MKTAAALPSLAQTLDHLDAQEKRYDEGTRIEQTRCALENNARIAGDREVIRRYYRELADRGLFVTIYGVGEFPWALPLHLPPYLIDLLQATARVLLALVRDRLSSEGPGYLQHRMPEGWLGDEMAEILHRYYLACEPDLAFDVLVYGVNSPRGTPFEAVRTSGDHLYAKILEAQSVDTYYGWLRQCIQAARRTGAFEEAVFTPQAASDGRPLTDRELDDQVRATYREGLARAGDRLLFLEIDPQNQPSSHNLELLSKFVGRGRPGSEALVLDPQDLYFEGERLHYRRPDGTGPIGKVISRIVDPDLKSYVHRMTADGKIEVVERLRRMFASLWPDMSKHLAGYYLIDKSSMTELSRTTPAAMAPKTWIVTEAHMAAYRADPTLLKQLAVKPLHGMSSKGVAVAPDLAAVEALYAGESVLAQELLRSTPVMPNINPELNDPDAAAGICSETRLLMHAGSPAVPDAPNRGRCILALSRCHYTSADPGRKIKGDSAGRGWFSNMGAILAVKGELGIMDKREAGLGMSPVCWAG
jgi:hypothetical protein